MKIPKWAWILIGVLVCAPILLFLVGILAGLLFPVATGVLRKDDRVHAEHTARNLKNAIAAYVTEYREYPLLDPVNDLTIDSGHAVMDVLFGSDAQKSPGGRNPRGIAFYTDRVAKPMGEGRFRKGVTLDDTTAGELWDPWGNHYRVRLDTNGDGRIENPEVPGTHLPESILVWSAGPDGDFETWADNVKSW
jgi:type II secretory pathway pseudopilin PulG